MNNQYLPSRGRAVFDVFVRLALSLTFAFAAANYFRNGYWALTGIDFSQIDLQKASYAVSVILVGLNALMIAILYVLRLPPMTSFAGILPCTAAILGGFLMAGLFFFRPYDNLPLWAQLIAMVLVVAGNAFALVVVSFLGRSFSILPEGRKLITHGPYAVVRHPLYAAEALTTVGMVITFFSPWALLLMIAQFSLQLLRIHYEEEILKQAFPEYEVYAQRTWRVIPGLY